MITFDKQVISDGRKWVTIRSNGERIGALIKWNSGPEVRMYPGWKAWLTDVYGVNYTEKIVDTPGNLTEAKRLVLEFFEKLKVDGNA